MPLTPLVSDGLGRRAAIVIGAVIMLGGVSLQVVATHVHMLIGARVISEFSITPTFVTTYQLLDCTSWIWPFVLLKCCSIAHR